LNRLANEGKEKLNDTRTTLVATDMVRTVALESYAKECCDLGPLCDRTAIEHSTEHFGQLVVYYRANNLIPPRNPGANAFSAKEP
jgi:hypothetical protein